jgi:hypothetical protein
VDQHLIAIVQAAERGLECPPVRILTGGLVIWGAPGPSAEFLELSLDPMIEQYEVFAKDRPRRERKQEYVDPETLAQEHLGNVRWPSAAKESEPTALTLLDAYLWPVAGGDGLLLAGIRIPVENVQAWWIAGGDVVEAKKGQSWFVGFGVPPGS